MQKKHLIAVLTMLILLAGTAIRLYDLFDPPLEVYAPRQMRAAVIVRDLATGEDPFSREGLIEPPLMELFTLTVYKLTGREAPWIMRLVSIFFWTVGGIALFDLASKIASPLSGLICIIFYFFNPFGILATRTMMPDPMMVAGTVLALWGLFHWHQSQTFKWAVITGLLAGFAIFVKSVAGFILIFPFVFFIFSNYSLKLALKNKQLWMIFLLTALPTAVYYYYGIVIDGRLEAQFAMRFFLDLISDPAHYIRWLNKLDFKFGLSTLVISVFGIALLEDISIKRILAGWWVGYFIYGLVFPYHIWTHEYYHLPLLPIIALSLVPTTALVIQKIEENKNRWFGFALIGGAVLIYIGMNMWNVRVELASKDYRNLEQDWIQVHNALEGYLDEPMIALTNDSNYSLYYFGHIQAAVWPSAGDLRLRDMSDIETDFERFWQTAKENRFFIVASKQELERQPELATRLEDYQIFHQGSGFTIYDLDTKR
jgi:4-amino-4-deoxy-L-arabinose transferase-like glycosyltransferase